MQRPPPSPPLQIPPADAAAATFPLGGGPSARLSSSTSAWTSHCRGRPTARGRARVWPATPGSRSPRTSGSGTTVTTRALPRPISGRGGESRVWIPPGTSGGTVAPGESMLRDPRSRFEADQPLHRSPQDITDRLDRLIADIRARQGPCFGNSDPGDILLVAHGHILRAFAMRWVGKALDDGLTFLLEAGGVGTLR